MTGDLKIDQGTQGFKFSQAATWVLQLLTLSGGNYQGFRCGDIQTSAGFRTINQAYTMRFKVHDNLGAVHTVMIGVPNVAQPHITIPFAGDIIPFQNNTETLGALGKIFTAAFINSVIAGTGSYSADLSGHHFFAGVHSDATRGLPGAAGKMIWNTTDNNMNFDNGTNWILPDGTIT